MQIEFGATTILYNTTITVGIFSAILLFLSPSNRRANVFLSALLIVTSLWLLDAFFNVSGIYLQDPDFYFKPIYYSFAFGPLVYCYVRSLIDSNFRLRGQQWLHFLPVFFQASLYWILAFQSYTYKRWFWLEVHQPVTYRIEFDGTFLSLMIYLILSIQLVRKYQYWVKEHFSEVSRLHLQWLKIILTVLVIWSTQWSFEVILREFYGSYFVYNFSMLILALLIVILAVGGILQDNLTKIGFRSTREDKSVRPTINPKTLEYIQESMTSGQHFLNPTLTLAAFAQAIDLPKRTVSEHLNHGLLKSFIDFVNGYRVEEVKRRLNSADKKVYTLHGLAMESGFRSKATFYRVFKQIVGQSPAEYLRP